MAYTAAQLIAAWTAANAGRAPTAAESALLTALAAQTQTGSLSDAAALAFVINSAEDDVQVAVQAYQFFTGKSPTQAGLAYLVNSPDNPADLGDAFYSNLNVGNRYINFAANLGLNGEGAAAFSAAYGALTFSQFVTVAYETVIGSSYATAAGINPTAAIADIISRQQNFVNTARERGLITSTSTAAQIDIATKAAVIGYLMYEGVKADVGIYAAGANNFVNALINGNAVYNTNIITDYAPQGGGTGNAVGGVGATPGGSTLSLSTNIDALVGTPGNDTFLGDQSVGVVGTVNASDSITGAGGSDTFRYFAAGTGGSTVVPTLNGVENVNLVNVAAAVALNFNSALITGLKFVSVEGNPAGAVTVTVPSGVDVGLTNVTSAAFGVTFTGTATQSSMRAVLSGTTAGPALAMDGAGITTLNLQSDRGPSQSATAANVIASLSSTGAETTVNVAGPQALTITAALAATVTKFDASASTGGTTATLATGGGATATVIGGSGVDSINVAGVTGKIDASLGGGNDVLTLGAYVVPNGSTANGGDGTGDVLSILSVVPGGASVPYGNFTAGNVAGFTNFEILRLATTGSTPGATTELGTFDASTQPVGITSYQIAGGTAGIALNNLAANPSVAFVGSLTGGTNGGLILNLKDATGGTDVANVTFTGSSVTGAGRTTTALSAPGVETINIVSTGANIQAATGSANAVALLVADPALSKVNVSGSGSFSLVTGALTTAATLDGAAATGQLNLNAAATVAAGIGININGGSNNDTLTAGLGALSGGIAPNQAIYGAGGGDIITLGAAHAPINTLVYKSAQDSLLDTTAGAVQGFTVGTALSKMDAVNNFITGQDKIELTQFGLSNVQAVIADKGAAASVAAMVTLANTAGFYNDSTNTLRGIAEVHVGADTYLFVDANKDGAFSAGTDLVIQFVGTAAINNAADN